MSQSYTAETSCPVAHDVYEKVKLQFGQCQFSPGFFDDFYADFTAQSPQIQAAFANTDMKAQKEALRSGLSILMMYAAGGNQYAEGKLDRIGTSHSRTGLNISPDLYKVWTDSLMRTVRKHVRNTDAETDAAWARILKFGADRIASHY